MFTLNNGEVAGSAYGDDKYLLAELLVEAMETLGHPLSFDEVRQYPGMPENPNIYATHFGSLEQACIEAWHYVDSKNNNQIISKGSPDQQRLDSTSLQLARIRADAEKSNLKVERYTMEKREEIIKRALEICRRHNDDNARCLTETLIKQDPILTYRDVKLIFGNVNQLRKVVRGELYKEKCNNKHKASGSDNTENAKSNEKIGDEFKKQNADKEEDAIFNSTEQKLEKDNSSVVEEDDIPETKPRKTRKSYSREDIIEILRNYYEEHGHWPTQAEVHDSPELPSWGLITKKLGGKKQWEKIVYGTDVEGSDVCTKTEEDISVGEDDSDADSSENVEIEISNPEENTEVDSPDEDEEDEECEEDEEYEENEENDDDDDDEDEDEDEETLFVEDIIERKDTPFTFEFSSSFVDIFISLSGNEDTVKIRITEH